MVAVLLSLYALYGYAQHGGPIGKAVCRGGSPWGHKVLWDMTAALSKEEENAGERVNLDRWDDVLNVNRFCNAECDLLYYRSPATDEAQLLKKWFPEEGSQPQTFFVGQARVAVIARRSNRIERISLDQIRDLRIRRRYQVLRRGSRRDEPTGYSACVHDAWAGLSDRVPSVS